MHMLSHLPAHAIGPACTLWPCTSDPAHMHHTHYILSQIPGSHGWVGFGDGSAAIALQRRCSAHDREVLSAALALRLLEWWGGS